MTTTSVPVAGARAADAWIFPEASLEAEFGDLLRLLRLVRPVGRTPSPMNRQVVLSFQGDKYLSATTWDYEVRRQVHVGTRQPSPIHGFILPARPLEDAVRLLAKGKPKTDKVKIQQTMVMGLPKVFVQADGYSLALGMNCADAATAGAWFEEISFREAEGPGRVQATWAAVDLLRLMGSVKHAIGKDDTTPVLCAAQILWDSGRLRILATDRYRLARATLGRTSTDSETSGQKFERLLPLKVWNLIAPIIKGEDELRITASDDAGPLLSITGENCAIDVLCHNGTYPKINELFHGQRVHAKLSRKELLRATTILQGMAGPGTPIVLHRVTGGMQAASEGYDGDRSKSPVMQVSGHEFIDTALNPHFLQETLAALPGDQLRISWLVERGPTKPVMVTDGDAPLGEQETEYLVMPVRMPADPVEKCS
ncbi:DNA polymerase III subunit beta [Glutamicibacter creatinolyticus]|uniref:DNA polymerase III subunit beta n=1 Tax=Glutamicibacter creatinolyticus TaxID=162496 RepID=UPI0032166D76